MVWRLVRPLIMRMSQTPHHRRVVIPRPRWDAADPMAALSPLQRRILLLRVARGRSAEEVATELSMSPMAVRVVQHRALEVLRAHLAGEAGQPTPG
ncbi:hypothetical protein Acsp05_25180 [Actinokineospora sp. NBRC 105648]|nr:hypothetical protein Acsp05_25180 [Actinokineospora sp. NBRC 105648]